MSVTSLSGLPPLVARSGVAPSLAVEMLATNLNGAFVWLAFDSRSGNP